MIYTNSSGSKPENKPCPIDVYFVGYNYTQMSGGQNYLLPAMDMAKVGGPLSVAKVCMCENRVSAVSVSGWSPIGCEGFRTNLKSQVHSLLL